MKNDISQLPIPDETLQEAQHWGRLQTSTALERAAVVERAPAMVLARSDAGPALPELPGIDTAKGLALLGGKVSLYLRCARIFRDIYSGGLAESFQEELEAGEWASLCRLAQSLKGSARTLGADALAERAERLTVASRLQRRDLAAKRLDALVEELARVMVGLARLEEAPPLQACPVPHMLDAPLRDMHQLLEQYVASALSAITALAQTLAGSPHHAVLMDIDRAIAAYRFQEAQEQMRLLAGSLGLEGHIAH